MIIVANWKAYVEDLSKAKNLFAVSKRFARTAKISIVLAPPAPLLGALAAGNKSTIGFAAQDISATVGGAQTGESTAAAYAAAGARYAIIGHSERRALGETGERIAEKVGHALAHGLTPILCVGERERDAASHYLALIREEITSALAAQTPKDRAKIIVAYEPLWAIGKHAADAISVSDLAEMVLYIRKVLAELLPGKTANRTTVLYGGSVEPENTRGLAGGTGIDGFLIGHASVDADQFSAIVRAVA